MGRTRVSGQACEAPWAVIGYNVVSHFIGMEETWAQIKGFEGIYEVSTLGRVKSLDRPQRVRGNGISTQKGAILKQWKQGSYMYCDLRKPGIKQKARIHVVVLETFNCSRPDGMVACHNNGDSTDNRLSNLRWGTYKENSKDKILHGTHRYGELCGKSKLTEAQAIAILESTKSNREIARDFGVCSATVSHIKTGRNWPHLQARLAKRHRL
jgi:hypothetical protein